VSKAHKIIFKKQTTWLMVPFYKIHFDLISGIVVYNSDQYATHFFNNAMQLNNIKTMA